MKESKLNLHLLFFLQFIIFQNLYAQTDTIFARYKRFLIESVQPGRNTDQLLDSFSNGQWNDINYQDTQPANWQPWEHMKRISDLALVWVNPKSEYYHDEQVWKVINCALDHWLEKRYKNSNWWHNQIGIPQGMRDVLFLLKENLTREQVGQALEVFAQHRVQGSGAGANLIWSADLGFHYGVLTNDPELMNKCRDLIVNEINITTEEGIQPDYSFHQHGARLQMFQYGAVFLRENVRLAWECRETNWAFPAEKIEILSDFVLNGWQWMARGVHTVPGTMDRSVSREGELQSPDLRPLIPYLCEIDPKNRNEFLSMAARQQGIGTPLTGFRYFPYSDFTAFQNDRFSFFLKTISTRTLATESINNENLEGKLLNSGDSYIVKNGKEYFDLMPVWNWNFLSGITVYNAAEQIVQKDFVGSVSDGKSGLTVMDYQLKGTGEQILKAKKMWACHDKTVVCLIAGLQTDQVIGDVGTALDQCRWQGDVTVNGERNVLKEGDYLLENVQWIHHEGLAYILLNPSTIDMHLHASKGSWSSINASGSITPITEKIFNPVILHSSKQDSLNTGYVLASAETSKKSATLAKNPNWLIIRNDTTCQAVYFDDDTAMIAFLLPGSVVISKKKLTVDKPCLILFSQGYFYASNPAGYQEALVVSFNHSTRQIILPANGLTTDMIKLE